MVFQSGFGIGFVATSFTLEPFDIQVLHFVMELQAFFSCENFTTFITWEFPILLEMNTVLVTFEIMNCVPWTFDHSCTNAAFRSVPFVDFFNNMLLIAGRWRGCVGSRLDQEVDLQASRTTFGTEARNRKERHGPIAFP